MADFSAGAVRDHDELRTGLPARAERANARPTSIAAGHPVVTHARVPAGLASGSIRVRIAVSTRLLTPKATMSSGLFFQASTQWGVQAAKSVRDRVSAGRASLWRSKL